MADHRKLTAPHSPEDPTLDLQIYEICCEAIRAAGGYLVDHPEDHATIVVFGAHQFEVKITQKR